MPTCEARIELVKRSWGVALPALAVLLAVALAVLLWRPPAPAIPSPAAGETLQPGRISARSGAYDAAAELATQLDTLRRLLRPAQGYVGGLAGAGAISPTTLAAEAEARARRLAALEDALRQARTELQGLAVSFQGAEGRWVRVDLDAGLLTPLRRAQESAGWLANYYSRSASAERSFRLFALLERRRTAPPGRPRLAFEVEWEQMSDSVEADRQLQVILRASERVRTMSDWLAINQVGGGSSFVRD